MSGLRPFPAAVLILAAAACTACGPAPEPSSVAAGPVAARRPPIRFTDVTREAGLDFAHDSGASEKRYLPETMGAGLAFVDFDGDDFPDLYFADGLAVDEAFGGGVPDKPAGRLYRNRGDGTFEDVTAGAGLGRAFLAMGVAAADLDGDGLAELFVSGVGAQRLYRNLGGCRFLDVTAESGLEAPRRHGDVGFGSGAAFFDADRDGRLDLIVGRYVPWSPATDLRCSPDGEHHTYCTPEVYASAENLFYRNLGDGRFGDATREAGLDRPAGKTLGIAVLDHDRDGWPDVVVANDTDRNHLFANRGDGTFAEIGIESGLAFSLSGSPRGAMGIDTGDLDGDGLTDLAIGNFAQELTAVYVATSSGQFRDDAARLGVGLPTLMQVAFGTLAIDLDLDGRLDLAFANGHIEPEIARFQSLQSYRQPLAVFRNHHGTAGSPTFALAGGAGGPLAETWAGRGLAAADFDDDGDLDLVLTQNGDRARLLRNDSPGPRSWLRVRLVGSAGTPFGARLSVVTGDRRIERTLRSGRSYLSAGELVVTFGLDHAQAVERLEVRWPSGRQQVVATPAVNRLLVLREPESRRAQGRLP